jgi:peptidyl-prolyl cis-trans isomerase C
MNRPQLLLCSALAAATLSAHAADELFEDRVIVRGPEFEITENELDQAIVQRKAQMAAMGRSIPEHLRLQVEKETVDLLILKHTLLGMATDEDRATATNMVNQQISGSPPQLLGQQAKLLGLTEAAFKNELIEQNTASHVVNREFQPKVVVTEEMSRKFYDDNPTNFEAPEMVKAVHVLIATKTPEGQDLTTEEQAKKKELAEKVLARAKAGEEFVALVAEFSDDPGVAQNNGEYTFTRNQMVKPFEDAAWALPPGEISDLVKTDFGYHIIKKIESLPARIQTFEEVDSNIRAHLGRLELQKVLQNYTRELKKDPSIQILNDKYKS